MTDTPVEDTTHEEVWVCVGKRISIDRKLLTFFKQPDGQEFGLSFKKSTATMRLARVGQQWKVVLTQDDKIKTGLSQLLPQLFQDHDQLMLWSAQEKLAELTLEQERAAKKTVDPIFDALQPLKHQYRRLVTPAQRAALLSAVIEIITR